MMTNLPAIGRFFGSRAQASRSYIARLRGSLRWSATLIGSITAALKKEVEKVPGAALAGEAIKELVDMLLNLTEGTDGDQEPSPVQRKGGAQSGGDTAK
jgi:hypothetical protein